MELSSQLAALRKAKGLSQEELAEKLGVSRQAISKWENGVSSPEMANLPKLCEIFEVTPNTLLGYEEEKAEKTPHENQKLRRPWYKTLILIVVGILIANALIALGTAAAVLHNKPAEVQKNIQGENILIESFRIISGNVDGSKKTAEIEFVPSIINDDIEFTLSVSEWGGTEKEYPVEISGGVCRTQIKLSMSTVQQTSLTVCARYDGNVYPQKLATITGADECSIEWDPE